MARWSSSIIIAAIAITLGACAPNVDSLVKESTATALSPDAAHRSEAPGKRRAIPLYTYKVVKSWPHALAFTEGLVFKDGVLLESSGLYRDSKLLRVDPCSGQLIEQLDFPEECFAEGVTVFRDRIYQLTLSGSGFIFQDKSMRREGEFSVDGEGWGLTHDDSHLIMSNGSNVLKFINPETFQTERTIAVTCNKVPVDNLNALQYIKGEIYANIWRTDYIVKINPKSGEITGWINLKGLLRPEERSSNPDAVLNGIAYDEENDRLVVTGKRWPKYFEIRLEKVQVAQL